MGYDTRDKGAGLRDKGLWNFFFLKNKVRTLRRCGHGVGARARLLGLLAFLASAHLYLKWFDYYSGGRFVAKPIRSAEILEKCGLLSERTYDSTRTAAVSVKWDHVVLNKKIDPYVSSEILKTGHWDVQVARIEL